MGLPSRVAVTLSIANHDPSLPGSFKTKPEIALAQIRWGCEAELPRGAALMDAGYGVDTDLRTSITVLRLAQGRVRQRSGRVVVGDHRSCCAAMTSTNRPRSRSLRWPCQ